MNIEYKVVPAPEKARKKRGLKGAALFAHSVEELMNELAAEGWTYVRADTLPQEERSGLTNKTTTYRNLLVFQRVTQDAPVEQAAPAPEVEAPAPTPQPEDPDDDVTNLWDTRDAPDDTGPDNTALIADRQSQRVDL